MSEASRIEVGTKGSAQLLVRDDHLAPVLVQGPADDFPPVFATMQMVGLMELAAARAMQPLLCDGQLSVGVTVDIAHSAPTPAGAIVQAEAVFTGMDGKLFVFDVLARDPGGEIGRGVHKRAIVDTARLLAAAAKRSG